MTSLHHARPVDDGRGTAPAALAGTAAPARRTSRRQAGPVDRKVTPKVPSQRQGKAQRQGTAQRTGETARTGTVPARAATAAGSLAARAKAATTAAAGSTAARTAGAKAVSARTAAAKVATRATTAAKAATAGRTAPARRRAATAPRATTVPPVAVVEPVVVEPVVVEPRVVEPVVVEPAAVVEPVVVEPAAATVRPAAPARPTPFRRAPETAAVEVTAVQAEDVEVTPVAEVAFVDEALADLPAEAGTAPAAERSRRGRHRVPSVRRRPALYLAAGLVGALSLGAALDTDPSARADSTAETVSVAEQLGIDAEATATLAGDAESTRLLQELVVSRNERDAATIAAADAQAAADVQAMVSAAQQFAAAAEAARPKAVAPVNGARLTSTFGARWGTLHAGIDLAAPMRTPEYAVMDGVVLEAGAASGYGLAVSIQHDNGDVTLYGHMDEILVEPGQVVRAGDTIALLGNRGQSTGPHLHFEVHKGGLDGTKVDPLPWLRERGVQV
jgi:murein DD-endopeptidase MepM/ murein hydrolase activator NlpD